jgi:flavodoxin
MSKTIIIYESTLGNTRSVAEKIAEGIKQVNSTELTVTHIKKVDARTLSDYDAILIGCPTHMGQPTRDTRNLVNKLDQIHLSGQKLAFFNCWSVPNCEGKPVKMLEDLSAIKAPNAKLFSPGLSVKVTGWKGPVSQEDLEKSIQFGVRFAQAARQ